MGTRFNHPTPIAPLIVLRVGFGLLMFISIVRFMVRGWITEFYIQPQFHFTYHGFAWVQPLPEWGMWFVFFALAFCAFTITIGLFYRVSMVSFFLLFTYVELLDQAFYLNHYYFVSLFSFLLIFLPLNGSFSLDVRLGFSRSRQTVPAWMVGIVRLQLGLVYFFAGLAKLNPDWLHKASPLAIWLPARSSTPLIGWLFDDEWVAYAMSWAGMLFDLTVAGWLWWWRSRPFAYLAVIIFHTFTGFLFQIGMFPWIMIACTLVFFDWHNIQKHISPSTSSKDSKPQWVFVKPLLAVFVLVQLIFPLRHFLYAGNVNWTEEGFRFAWRVMLVEKTGHATFFVRDPATQAEWTVLPSDYLTLAQEKQMSFQPDMLVQFAHYLAEQFPQPVEVRAEVYVSWNGRSSRLLLDPTVDLTQVTPDWRPRDWVYR